METRTLQYFLSLWLIVWRRESYLWTHKRTLTPWDCDEFTKDNVSKIPRAWCHGTKFKCNTFNSHLFLCLLHNLMPSWDFPDRPDRSCDFENWSLHIIEVLYVLHWRTSISSNISLSFKFRFVYHSVLYVIIVSFMIENSKSRPMFLTLYFLVLYHVYDYLVKVIWWAAWSFFMATKCQDI